MPEPPSKPNKFRLTYRASDGMLGDGSHERKRIETDADATALATKARLEKPSRKKNFLQYASRQKSVRKPYRKRQIHSTETTTTLDISSVLRPLVEAREARPSEGAEASGPVCDMPRSDLLQSQIASRLGPDGWLILQDVSSDCLSNLITLEQNGKLNAAALEIVRLVYRQRGAA